MKTVRIILIILGSLFGIWLIASVFFPSHCHLERTAVINVPAQTVFDQVNNLKNWEKWSYWAALEPEAKRTYEGPESGTGSKFSWQGRKTGTGSMTIVESAAPRSIKTELDFAGGGKAQSSFQFEPDGGGTKVTWDFDSDVGFSQRLFMGLMLDKYLGEAYEQGLAKLKQVCEAIPAQPATVIEEVNAPLQWVIAARDTTNLEGIAGTLGACYESIMRYIAARGLKNNEHPLAIWHKFDPGADFVDVEAGIAVSDSVAVGKGMRLVKLGGKAVKATHHGAYSKAASTYDAMQAWMKQHNITPAGAPWEVYITDPMLEKDTSKWLTDIYFPI